MQSRAKTCLLIVATIFSLSLFLSLSSFAQENYKDGYVVLSGRDTVRGRIDFREWVYNPSKIVFQDLKTGATVSYTTTELSSFYVAGEVYRRYKARIYPFSLNDVVTARDDWKSDPYDSVVFLRLVTAGKVSLYQYENHRDLVYFFIQTQDETPKELRIRTEVQENDGHQTVSRDLLYHDQLNGLMSDCGQAAKKGQRVAYEENALRKLVFAYNNCGMDTTEQQSVETSAHGKAVSFIPMVGYLHSSVHPTGEGDAARMSWPAYNTVAAGIGMQILVPRAREQFSFFADLLFHHFSSTSGTPVVVNSFMTDNGVFDFNQLKLDIQFRYRYPEGKIRPFLNAGFSNSLTISNKSYMNEHNSFDNSNTHAEIFGVSGSMRNFEIGFLAGGGITAGRLNLEARIEKVSSLSSVLSVNSPMTNFYLLVGFRL